MKKITLENYKKDKYYEKVVNAFDNILETSNYISAILIFTSIKLPKKEDVEDWRKGRISYLEKVINCNPARVKLVVAFLEIFFKPPYLMNYFVHLDSNILPQSNSNP